MRLDRLKMRVDALEASQRPACDPPWCDWRRKLANCNAALRGEPWECTGTPERRAKREADLARYSEYFDKLYAEHGLGEGHEEY